MQHDMGLSHLAPSSPHLDGLPGPADMQQMQEQAQQLGGEGGGDRVVCNLCMIRRADLKLCCGHAVHARCVFQYPLTECPVCKVDISAG
jgi:DNA-binding helix-hairpin-helix protein with protein kinase domain